MNTKFILIVLVVLLLYISFKREHFYNKRLKTQLNFIHIPKNAGTEIENLAAKKNKYWGYFAWTKMGYKHNEYKTSDFFTKNNDYWFNKNTGKYLSDTRMSKVLNKYRSYMPWHVPPDIVKEYNYKKNEAIFAVVRNPYSRFISIYRYNIGGTAKTRHLATIKGLNDFVKKELKGGGAAPTFAGEGAGGPTHLLPQHFYTHGKLKCDHILKYENLKSEFNNLMKMYNLDIKIGDNKSYKSKLKVSDLTDESKEIIYNYYKKDFELFGYEK
jgi:hypothetical protein